MKHCSCIVHYSLGTNFRLFKFTSRYEASGKYKESDELTYDGIVNMNKYGQVTIGTFVYIQCRLFQLMIWP